MHAALMGPEMTCRIERLCTLLTSLGIHVRAGEGLPVKVHRHDVSIERRVFTERLATRRIFSTSILFPPIMRRQVSSQSRSGDKRLSTSRSVANVVSNLRMRALHMVVEMRCPQKRLSAAIVLTFEDALVSV